MPLWIGHRNGSRRWRARDSTYGMLTESICTSRLLVSTARTSTISTVAFFCLRRMWRIGQATSAGRERRGRDLVEQRLEAMMVLPVDHGDLDRRGA